MFTYLVYFYENKFRLKTVRLKLKTKYNTYTNTGTSNILKINTYIERIGF